MAIFNLFKKGIQVGSESTGINMLFQKTSSIDVSFGRGKALDYYEKSVYVNKAIEKRADKVAEVELYLKDRAGKKITEHELLDLLAKPNNFQTKEQFFALWQKYYDAYGEAYILILKDQEFLGKKKFELRLLDPKECEPEFDIDWKLVSISYKGKKGRYTANEIIYDYRPNPRNQFRGVSLLRAGAYTIETNIELDKLNYNLVKAGGKVDGIMSFKNESVSPLQLLEFKEKYKEQLKEMAENGNVVFMGGDAEYQRVNLSPEELGYLGTKKMSLNDICILTDVPKVLLNSVDDVKFDNADASIKLFLTETIVPLIRQKVNKLNEKLELIPQEYELCFVDPTPEDIDRLLKINESGAKNFYLTPNEMRANIGYEPIEGGDNILVPFNFTPATLEEKGLKKKEFSHPLKSYEVRRNYFQKRIIIQNRLEGKFLKVLNRYLKQQKLRVLDGMGKSITKDLIDSSFNLNKETKIGLEILTPVLREFMKEAGKDAKDLVGSDYKFVWTDEMEHSLDKRAKFFLDSINETTFKKLKNQFKESVERGESRNDLMNRIEDTYDDISKSRANTIARTEVHSAVNNGTIEGYRQANMPIKIWVAVMDSETRDSHAEMDGEEVPLDKPFSNGLMFPGDPRGDAEETINCRCQI